MKKTNKMNENEIFWAGTLNVKNYIDNIGIRYTNVFDELDVKYGRLKYVNIDWAGLMKIEYVVEISNGAGFFKQYTKNKTINFGDGDELDRVQENFNWYKENENLDEFTEFYSDIYTKTEINKLIKYCNDEIHFSDLGDKLIDKLWNYSLENYIEYMMMDYRCDNCNEDDDYDDGIFGDINKKIDDLFFTKIVDNLSAGYTTGYDLDSWLKCGNFDDQCHKADNANDNWWGAKGRVEETEFLDDIKTFYQNISKMHIKIEDEEIAVA